MPTLDVPCSRGLVAVPIPALSAMCSIDRRRFRAIASRGAVSRANGLSPVSSRKRRASVRSLMAAILPLAQMGRPNEAETGVDLNALVDAVVDGLAATITLPR